MLRARTLLLMLFSLFFSSKGHSQVVFANPKPAVDTLTVSIFGRPERFIKNIKNKFPARTEFESDTTVLAWLLDRMTPNLRMSAPTNYPADRLRHIPSILPVRIARQDQYRVSSGFGLRCHPVTGRHQPHNGMDFPQPPGTPVYATADGYISKVGIQPDGLGLAIRIVHHDGFATTYGHLSRYEVQPGQWVKRGQRIGRVGQTGLTTGPHLHYIVWYRGHAVDPRRYCFLAVR